MIEVFKESDVTKDAIKQLIKVKFGNVRRFCDVSRRNYNSVRGRLYKSGATNPRALADLYKTICKTSNRPLDEEISLVERGYIKDRIEAVSGNVTAFCVDYIQFRRSTVNDIIDGRKRTRTKRFLELYKFLENGRI